MSMGSVCRVEEMVPYLKKGWKRHKKLKLN